MFYMEATKRCADRRMDKQDTAHYTMEYDLVIKKKTELIPFLAKWMDLEMITLSK